jgi:hypothetical protein
MEAMRQSWTDDRMDDLSRRMDERFRHVDQRFDQLEAQIIGMRTEMNMRFDSIYRTMIQFGGVMVAALVGLLATQLGLILALA